MATSIRIKRRSVGGAAGAPATLLNGELAFNEQDDTLYYGKGSGVAGAATNVIAIAGPGKYPNIGTTNTWTGAQTFNGNTTFGGAIDFGSGTITNFPLDKLTDVTVTTPSNGQVLAYDNAASQWKNVTPNSTDVRSLLDTEVTAATGADTSAKITAALINKGLITGVADLASGDITVVSGSTVGVSGSYIYDGAKWVVLPSGGGGGTVTSVSVSVPPWLGVTGSPVTTSGTIAITSAAEAANTILAGPATGANAVPSFRSLVAGDMPDLSATYALATRSVTVENGLTIGNVTAPTGTSSTLAGNLFIGIGAIDCGTF
jgi:hypothetical protein